MIGVSLSMCVQQIISGTVSIDDVEKIVTGTKAPDEQTWNKVITAYRTSCWRDNPDEGERVVRQLIAEGKIEQPRLINGNMPNISNRRFWVDDVSKIQWCD